MGARRLAGVPGKVEQVTGQRRKYAAAAVVELVGAQVAWEGDAPKRLRAAYEEVERAMESYEEEKEQQDGDN